MTNKKNQTSGSKFNFNFHVKCEPNTSGLESNSAVKKETDKEKIGLDVKSEPKYYTEEINRKELNQAYLSYKFQSVFPKTKTDPEQENAFYEQRKKRRENRIAELKKAKINAKIQSKNFKKIVTAACFTALIAGCMSIYSFENSSADYFSGRFFSDEKENFHTADNSNDKSEETENNDTSPSNNGSDSYISRGMTFEEFPINEDETNNSADESEDDAEDNTNDDNTSDPISEDEDSSETAPEDKAPAGTKNIQEGKYRFRNLYTSLYLDVANGSFENKANVQQWDRGHTSSPRNEWIVKYAGNGYYRIASNLGDGSMLLDLFYGSTDNGANIRIHRNTNSDAQLFKFVPDGRGYYTICTKASNDKSCIQSAGTPFARGGNIEQWERNGHANQLWALEKI